MRAAATAALSALFVIVLVASHAGAASSSGALRVALVIGNAAYEHAPRLPNPDNDARAMARLLSGLGFQVVLGADLEKSSIESKIKEFVVASRGAELALFYYAGHAIQVNGENYLVPTDAKVEDETSLDFELVNVSSVTRFLGGQKQVGIVLLDACRDDPFLDSLRSIAHQRSLSLGRGLAPIATEGGGLLVAYATAPGDTAADGAGPNSPFTTALLKYLPTPGLELELAMKRVKAYVASETDQKQRPWTNSDLTTEVYLASIDRDGDAVGPGQVEPGLPDDLDRPTNPSQSVITDLGAENVTVMPKTKQADQAGIGRAERLVTVSKAGALKGWLLNNGFDSTTYEMVAGTLRNVLASSALNMPKGARLRILMGPSRVANTLIPVRLSIYFPDPLSGELKHAVTAALSDRGNYVLGLEPEAIDLSGAEFAPQTPASPNAMADALNGLADALKGKESRYRADD